jgi:hypothetical protein
MARLCRPVTETTTLPDARTAGPLPGGPYDLEFFLDPMCPFAWQTSVWLRRVAELRSLRIGWRFISLRMLNEELAHAQLSEDRRAAYFAGTRVLRVAAAARDVGGNDAVASIYEQWGRALWYGSLDGRDFGAARVEIVNGIDLGDLLEGAGLSRELASAADDETIDDLLRAETLLALDRAGNDLGTPIITFDAAVDSASFFGPVISTALSDDDSLELYDAVVTLARLGSFSELKSSKRPPFDLPLLS